MNSSSTNKAFLQQQKLASYCRTGRYTPIKGTTPGRVSHYRRLVYNNIEDTLQSAYPLAHRLLSGDEWDDLVTEFFSRHSCSTYQVWKIPGELYSYVCDNPLPLKGRYPFLTDLLYFEWAEIELFMMEDGQPAPFAPEGDLIENALVLNPEFRLFRLDYPVHAKTASTITQSDKGDYYILLFREPDSGKVRFLECSPLLVWLLEQLLRELPLKEIAGEAASLFGIPAAEVINGSLQFLADLKDSGFVLGCALP